MQNRGNLANVFSLHKQIQNLFLLAAEFWGLVQI